MESFEDQANLNFPPEVIDRIHRMADNGQYPIRGLGARRKVPTFDDLVFLTASVSRYPLEGYRERCETRTVLGSRHVLRFDRVERAAHWANALLFGILMATALPLYFVQVETIVGRRALIAEIHTWCGVALPVPLIISLAGPWGARLRSDVRSFNLWTRSEIRWRVSRFLLLAGGCVGCSSCAFGRRKTIFPSMGSACRSTLYPSPSWCMNAAPIASQ